MEKMEVTLCIQSSLEYKLPEYRRDEASYDE